VLKGALCVVKDALLHVKRCPFAMQNMPFYKAKGRRLKSRWEES